MMKETSHYYSNDDKRSATVVKDGKRFGAICVGYDRRVLRTKDFFEGVSSTHTSYFDGLADAENFAENWVLYQD
tara:strand:+ start:236 stop:457 length:222 start_codon:yes stop_codon:yes gene_type:complete